MSDNFRAPFLLNFLVSEDIDRNAQIAHVSGDFLLSNKYHHYKAKFLMLVDSCIHALDSAECLEIDDWDWLRVALARLQINAKYTSFDYFMQCLGIRRRAFASLYYLIIRFILRKLKRLIMY